MTFGTIARQHNREHKLHQIKTLLKIFSSIEYITEHRTKTQNEME